MNIIVQKFGGASLCTLENIRDIIKYISPLTENNHKIVIVVSAFKKETDSLIHKVDNINNHNTLYNLENLKLRDMVISSGEQVTSGLLSMSLNNANIRSTSLLGWQVPIHTNNNYGNSQIQKIYTKKIFKLFENFQVIVIAGFQGIYDGTITTLGRGGSDITAVALAIALNAKRCDIYTDVSGIYNSDPVHVKNTKKILKISYEMMLSMSYSGAKILHFKAVQLAKRYNINLRILSSFNILDMEGSLVTNIDNIENHDHFQFEEKNNNIKIAVISKKMYLINLIIKKPNQIDVLCNIHNTLSDSAILLHGTDDTLLIALKIEDFHIFQEVYNNDSYIYKILEKEVFIITIISDYKIDILPFLKKKFDSNNILIKNFYFLDDKIRIVVTGILENINKVISMMLDSSEIIIENV